MGITSFGAPVSPLAVLSDLVPTDLTPTPAGGAYGAASRGDHAHKEIWRGAKNGQTGGAWSTASTSYVNYGATATTVAMTKARSDTNLFIVAVTTYWFSALGAAQLGLLIGGADYNISGSRYANEASSHKTHCAVSTIAGIAAGAITATLRIRVTSGTPTLSTDANDYGDVLMLEGFLG